MQTYTAGTANTVHADLLTTAGVAITSGTVTAYLRALTGTNAGKYYKADDGTWSVVAASAGTMSFTVGSSWEISIAAGAWTANTRYKLVAVESGDLNLLYSEEIVPADAWGVALPGSYAAGSAGYLLGTNLPLGAGANEWPYTLTSSRTSLPVSGAFVWVTTDVAGTNVVASGYTNTFGVVTFYLDDGTYYVWRSHASYSFTNPDTEVVP